jgi:uridine kinase
VSAAFEENLARARTRDLAPLGSAARVEQRFGNRYLLSQQHYFDTVGPTDFADMVVHNDEPERPVWEVRQH